MGLVWVRACSQRRHHIAVKFTMRFLSLPGLVVAFLCTAVVALHESDVGVVDWHLPQVGVPLTSSLSTAPAFHAKPGRPPTEALLLTATRSNVLAAIHASNGSLGTWHLYCRRVQVVDSGTAWRFIHEPTDHIVHYQIDGESKSSLVVHQYHLIPSRSGHIFVRSQWRDAQNI